MSYGIYLFEPATLELKHHVKHTGSNIVLAAWPITDGFVIFDWDTLRIYQCINDFVSETPITIIRCYANYWTCCYSFDETYFCKFVEDNVYISPYAWPNKEILLVNVKDPVGIFVDKNCNCIVLHHEGMLMLVKESNALTQVEIKIKNVKLISM